jgi:hypothetical protein
MLDEESIIKEHQEDTPMEAHESPRMVEEIVFSRPEEINLEVPEEAMG